MTGRNLSEGKQKSRTDAPSLGHRFGQELANCFRPRIRLVAESVSAAVWTLRRFFFFVKLSRGTF